jgi:hypothetical protein
VVSDVPSGVAITFVAPEGEREMLRAILRDMATPREGEPVDVFAGCTCASPPAGATARATVPEAKATGSPGAKTGASMQAKPFSMSAWPREDDTATGAILVLRTRLPDEATALTTIVSEKMRVMREGCH